MLRRAAPSLWRGRARPARQPFFSFANPLTNPEALVKSHQETKVVPFSPEDMFDVVADVDRYREFLPFCVDSKVLRRPNDNVMEASLRIGFKVFTEAYTSRVIMKRPEKIVIKSIESPTFKRIESEWVFKRQPNPNACEVNFRVTFEVASFLHANAIHLFFDDVAVTQLNAFIGRAAKLHSINRRPFAAPSQQAAPKPSPQPSPQHPQQQRSSPPAPNGAATPVKTANRSAATTATAAAVGEPSSLESELPEPLSPAIQKAASIIRDDVWSQDYERLRQTFRKYAVDNEKLFFGAFVKACRELGCDHEDLRHIGENSALAGAIFSSFEYSSTPKDWLNLEEFTVGVYLMTKGTVEEKAHTLFHIIDSGGDGKISRDDLRRAMERRIRTVKKIFPKLLKDQVKLQMEGSNVKSLGVGADQVMSDGLAVIERLMEEIEQDIPLAVNQIFLEADLDQDDFITQDEWLFAWQVHPEFVELMTIDGMKKVAQWASVVSTGEESDSDDSSSGSDGKKDTRLTYVD